MVFGIGNNPDKLEQKAIAAEQKGKSAKAQKYREKAQKIRANQATQGGAGGSTTTTQSSTFVTNRTPAQYETNALKWEQRGNYTKAQKNREKVWRLQNPTYGPNVAAPQFYQNNQFVGYNIPLQGGQQPIATQTNVLPPVVETHVHATIVQQTTRPEKITEVQPVIHREIDAPQVRVIEKHVYETVPSQGPAVVTNAAIVQETIKPRVIEEIQPVVHREVPAPFVERVEQHVTEHITQPAVVTKQVLQDNQVHIAGQPGLAQQAGQPGLAKQTTTTTTNTTNTTSLNKH